MADDRLREYISEDVGEGDITSNTLIGDQTGKAHITANEGCVLAGLEEAAAVFSEIGLVPVLKAKDGQKVAAGQEVLVIEGRLKDILLGERVALNFLMRMSGIATETSKVIEECRKRSPRVSISATRKTTPGFRYYEKKAVRLGGGDPHRYGLDDGILIKDNHLSIVGSVTEAVRKAKEFSFTKKVEVEVEDLAQAEEAARAGADIIMLDNMDPDLAQRCYKAIKKIDPRAIVEVSGGVTPETAPLYANCADIISMGWITHSARAVQFSLHVI